MEDEPDPDDDLPPPPPPAAFGLRGEPVGCGTVGGLGFAALMAPVFFTPPDTYACLPVDGDCVEVGKALWAGLVPVALLGLAFGAATAALVSARVRAWRAGRRVRPPLWVAFVALLILGMIAAGFALAPLQLLIVAALG